MWWIWTKQSKRDKIGFSGCFQKEWQTPPSCFAFANKPPPFLFSRQLLPIKEKKRNPHKLPQNNQEQKKKRNGFPPLFSVPDRTLLSFLLLSKTPTVYTFALLFKWPKLPATFFFLPQLKPLSFDAHNFFFLKGSKILFLSAFEQSLPAGFFPVFPLDVLPDFLEP